MRGAIVLASRASVDVPEWYVDALLAVRGTCALLSPRGGLSVTRAPAKVATAPAEVAPPPAVVFAPAPALTPKKPRKR